MFFETLRNNGTIEGYQSKIITDAEKLKAQVDACKELGARIVVTIGSWDLLHIGHLRYLIKARSHGDVLVVGVDTDRVVKLYKGPDRPTVPDTERVEMLSYQDCVTFVTTLDDVTEKGEWEYDLIDLLRPDVFVAVEDSYPPEQQEDIRQYCEELVVLPRQAENTSTTQIVQRLVKGQLMHIIRELEEEGSR